MRTRPTVRSWEQQPLRSLLFAPGNHARKLEKVGRFGSDAIVLDLEDAVADSEKVAARESVRHALPTYAKTPVVLARVNGEATGLMADDVRAVTCADLDGIVVPKVERVATLIELDALLAELEAAQGLAPAAIRLLGLFETAAGIARCEEIALAAPPRVVTFVFGIGDFTADIGTDPSPTGEELLYARSRIVVAARAAGRRAPIDGPFLPSLEDIDALVEDARRARRLGFGGRVVVYPPHVEPVQRAFSELGDDEVTRLRRIVDAFEEAERDGSASIQVDGQFIDYPPYQRAKERLRLYDALGAPERAASTSSA
jgi:citrate lyase subunit beta / citryl-CoA lyase